MKKIKEISVITSTYKDKNGQEKNAIRPLEICLKMANI
jgi:hypothetical protein